MSLQLRPTTADQWTTRVVRYLDSGVATDREKARQLLREVGSEQALCELADILRDATKMPRWVTGIRRYTRYAFVVVRSAALYWFLFMAFRYRAGLVPGMVLFTVLGLEAYLSGALQGTVGNRRRIDNALTAFLAEAGLARSGAAVFPLLDVAALLTHYPTLERDNRRLLPQLQSALARLLPRLADDEAQALTPAQRALLRDWVGSATAPASSPAPEPLVVGALLSLAAVRDPAAIPDAVWLARHHSSERLRTAAAACARAAGSRDALSDPR